MVNTGHSVRLTQFYHSIRIQQRKVRNYKDEICRFTVLCRNIYNVHLQGGSNMTGTDLYVKKPHCVAAVRP